MVILLAIFIFLNFLFQILIGLLINFQQTIDIDSVDPYMRFALEQFEREMLESKLNAQQNKHFISASNVPSEKDLKSKQVIFSTKFEQDFYNTLVSTKMDHRLF
jgi:hypothetical protein